MNEILVYALVFIGSGCVGVFVFWAYTTEIEYAAKREAPKPASSKDRTP